MEIIDRIEVEQIKKEKPVVKPGETVRVHIKVVEGEKERTQVFEGTVIGVSNKRSRSTFTVRKISYGIGVERIFPLYSLRIEKVEVVSRGRVRRAKLYFLRDRSGKGARLYEREGR